MMMISGYLITLCLQRSRQQAKTPTTIDWLLISLTRSGLKASLIPSRIAFDHLVVMLRDELDSRAPAFEAGGYRLSAPGYHNLGSMNRLIVLNTSYIELLGWPAGTEPKRKEIADQALGLDALVFRSDDAEADYLRLEQAGFDVQPVSHLERPLNVQGGTETARFNTVRFNTQPVPGLRMYFCQHLTPEYIWDEEIIQHPNGAKFIHSIFVTAPNAEATAQTVARLVDAQYLHDGDHYLIKLANTELIIVPAPETTAARIERVILLHADGNLCAFDDRSAL